MDTEEDDEESGNVMKKVRKMLKLATSSRSTNSKFIGTMKFDSGDMRFPSVFCSELQAFPLVSVAKREE